VVCRASPVRCTTVLAPFSLYGIISECPPQRRRQGAGVIIKAGDNAPHASDTPFTFASHCLHVCTTILTFCSTLPRDNLSLVYSRRSECAGHCTRNTNYKFLRQITICLQIEIATFPGRAASRLGGVKELPVAVELVGDASCEPFASLLHGQSTPPALDSAKK